MSPIGAVATNNWKLNITRGAAYRGPQLDMKKKKTRCANQKQKVEEIREKARIRSMKRRKKLKQEKQDQVRALLMAQVQQEQLKQENQALKERYKRMLSLRGMGGSSTGTSTNGANGVTVARSSNPASDMNKILLEAALQQRLHKQQQQQQNLASLMMMNGVGVNGLHQGMNSAQSRTSPLVQRQVPGLFISPLQEDRDKVLPSAVRPEFQDILTLVALGNL